MVDTGTSEALNPGGFLKRLGYSELAALIVGFLYVSGYFINSIFVRNLGIPDTELLRLEYIKIGFTFVLTLGFIYLPIGAFSLTYRVRSSSGLPHFYMGLIGNSLNTTFCLAFPLFLAFFITKHEWDMVLNSRIIVFTSFKSSSLAAVTLFLFGMAVVPAIERLINRRLQEPSRMKAFRFFVEPLRYAPLLLGLYLVGRLLYQIPWIKIFVSGAFIYFLVVAFFVGGLSAATLWIKLIHKIKGSWLVYTLIGVGIAILYYLAITSYVFGIYTFIPINRGGRLPLTRAYLEVTGHSNLFTEERVVGGVKLRGPSYIIEDQADTLFVASDNMDRWLYEFVPIHAIRKENIQYVYLERITDGFPRTTPNMGHGIMLISSSMLPPEFYEARRVFQYDYIYVDAILLCVWLLILIKNREYRPIIFGLAIAPIIYLIDAAIWWNSTAGPNYGAGTFIREYWIGGTQMPHPLGSFRWIKFGADFMMTISYALFTFPWLAIVLEEVRQRKLVSRKVIGYTLFWLGTWLTVPLLSIVLPINDVRVETVRHMNTQLPFWVSNLIIGYGLLIIIYRKDLYKVLWVFCIGVVGALVMELPLYLFRIRPTGFIFLLFEGLILLNQGAPYVFLFIDKVMPRYRRKADAMTPITTT
jgi:hypothetical protein